MSQDITMDEWIAAIQAAQSPAKGDNGFSATELCDHTGMSKDFVCKQLRRLISTGAVAVGRGYRRNIVGQLVPTPVYRFCRSSSVHDLGKTPKAKPSGRSGRKRAADRASKGRPSARTS